MSSTIIKKICSVLMSCLIVFSMLLALPLTGFADDMNDTTENDLGEEAVREIASAEELHELFDALANTNLYGRLRVVLMSDISTNKGVLYSTNREDNELIFDLNGHSITVDSDVFYEYNVLTVDDKANVIITGNGKLIAKTSSQLESQSAVNIFGGNVTIENGTFEAANPLNVYTSKLYEDSVRGNLIVNGGTFIGKNPLSVSDASVTVNDGVFSCYPTDDFSVCVNVQGKSDIMIRGGRFEGSNSSRGFIFDSEGAVSIEGGTFIGSTLIYENSWEMFPDMDYQISGGDFTGVDSIFYLYIYPIPSSQLNVNGGTFTDAQREDLLEATRLGDSDYAKAVDLRNYWQEEVPVLEYSGKELRPSADSMDMTVELSDGYHGLKYFDSDVYKYSTSYKNNTNIGLATVTFTGKKTLTGTAKATFKIVPKQAAWKSIKAGKKSFTATVKAQKGGVRYQIQYRTLNGKWKSKWTGKTSLTVKNLKSKKKYQVRVRAYKTVKKKTYYGKWSKTWTVKVR